MIFLSSNYILRVFKNTIRINGSVIFLDINSGLSSNENMPNKLFFNSTFESVSTMEYELSNHIVDSYIYK